MSSKLLYREGGRLRLLSYCIESPVVVLERVFSSHRVQEYCGIQLPFDYGDDDFFPREAGLIIREKVAPQGTAIVGQLSGIDFNQWRITDTRSKSEMKDAFGSAIATSMQYFLDEWGTDACYLDFYDLRKEEKGEKPLYERRLKSLLEIAEMAFKIKNPTVEDLRNFLQ